MGEFKKYDVSGTIINKSTNLAYGMYKGMTMAPSAQKAKSNVLFHAKQAMHLNSGANIAWYDDVVVTRM